MNHEFDDWFCYWDDGPGSKTGKWRLHRTYHTSSSDTRTAVFSTKTWLYLRGFKRTKLMQRLYDWIDKPEVLFISRKINR